MSRPPSFPFPLETDHQTTIPLSVSDLELDKVKREIRLGPWIARIVALALVGTGGYAIWHLYSMQQSTASALAGANSDHADTRGVLRDARAELAAAELRIEELEANATTAQQHFESETTALREQLGPELTGSEEVSSALNALEHVGVQETTSRRVRVRLAPYRMFAGNSTELSERGAEYLAAIAEVLRAGDFDIAVEARHRSRETAATRALAVSAYLGGAGEIAARRLKSTALPSARRPAVQLVLTPR